MIKILVPVLSSYFDKFGAIKEVMIVPQVQGLNENRGYRLSVDYRYSLPK
jgi:hypothetical protein